jgi:hypothetical protein
VKTTVKNKDYVKKALQRMGLEFEEGNFTIKQYGKSEKAEIRLANAVGLSQQADGTWAMVGDPYHVDRRGKNGKLRDYYGKAKKFGQELSTAYAIEESKGELENHQFFCTENEEAQVGADGKITMVFSQYA